MMIYNIGIKKLSANMYTSFVLLHKVNKVHMSASEDRFKPSSKIFLPTVAAVLLLWIIYVSSVLFCYAFMHVCLLMPCGHLLGKG